MMKVLVYEPTNQIANLVSSVLTKNGIVCLAVIELKKIISLLKSGEYKIALIDYSSSAP